MSNLKTLLKFNLKYYLIPKLDNKKEKKKFIAMIIVLGLVFLLPLISMILSIYFMAEKLATVGAVPAMLSSLFGLSQIATIVFSFSTYLQIMYYSKDNEILATLPVSTSEVFISKIITITVLEMLVTVLFVLPSTIVTAVALGSIGIKVSAIYYIFIPISTITLPLVPILFISILSFPIMKLVSYFKKHQTFGAIVAIVLIMAVLLAIYIPLYSNIYGNDVPVDTTQDEEAMQDGSFIDDFIVSDEVVDMITSTGKIFFHTFALAKAMLGIDVGINLLIYFGFSILIFAIGILLAIFLYNSTLSTMLEGGTIDDNKNKEGKFEESSTIKALISREIKVVSRDSQKLINVLMGAVIAPVMTFIMMFVMNQSPAQGDASLKGFLIGFGVFMTIIMQAANVGISTGFSLEGPNLVLFKTYPTNFVNIYKAKLFVYDILDFISVFVSSIIVLIFAKCNILDLIFFNVTSDLVIMSVNVKSLNRDMKKPKVNWTNIKEITKNNFGTLVPLLYVLPFGILSLVLGILFSIFIQNKWLFSLAMWLPLLVIGVIYYFALRFNYYKQIDQIFEEVEI